MRLKELVLSQSLLAMPHGRNVTTSKIEVRIGKVLEENIIVDDTYYFAKNDNIKIKSLGINASGALNNSWLVNISPKYDVKNVTLIDSSNFTYNIETNSKNNLRIGDKVIAIQSYSVEKQGVVIDIISEKEFTFSRAGKLTEQNLVSEEIF